KENKDGERGGKFADGLNAAHVDPRDQRNDEQRDGVVPPAGELRKVVAKIIRELHGVSRAEQKRGAPVPPSGEKSPEIAESGPYPAIESTLNRHGRGEFGGDQRHGNRPEEGNNEQVDQRHAGAGGRDHVLETERSAGAVREHHPDEVEEPS